MARRQLQNWNGLLCDPHTRFPQSDACSVLFNIHRFEWLKPLGGNRKQKNSHGTLESG